MSPRQEAFADFLDRVFVDCPFDWTKATMLARVLFHDMPLAGKDILDLGCGVASDRADFFLNEKKAASYLGVDLCRKALEASRLDDKRARVIWADMHQLLLDDSSVDLVYCRGVATYARDLSGALKEAWRVLRPGGIFIVDFSRHSAALTIVRFASFFCGRLPYGVKMHLSHFLANSIAPCLGFMHGKKPGEDPVKIQQVILLSLFSPFPARGVTLGWVQRAFRRLGAVRSQVLKIPDSDVFSNKTTLIISATK